jgi:hypothetical protein
MSQDTPLPIPDFDQLPTAGLAHRVRTLDADGLVVLLDHERAHADRPAVVQLLEHRLDRIRSGDAQPSGGDPAGVQPEHAPPPAAGSPVPDGDRTDTNQPLRHGVAGQTPNRELRAR